MDAFETILSWNASELYWDENSPGRSELSSEDPLSHLPGGDA
jgi:hypothetical protein